MSSQTNSLRYLQIIDLHRLNWFRQLKAKNARIEIELRIQRPPNILRAAEAMLFTRESDIRYRQAFHPQRLNHFFGLAGWDDFVFQPLKKYYRARKAIGEIDRRSFDV